MEDLATSPTQCAPTRVGELGEAKPMAKAVDDLSPDVIFPTMPLVHEEAISSPEKTELDQKVGPLRLKAQGPHKVVSSMGSKSSSLLTQ